MSNDFIKAQQRKVRKAKLIFCVFLALIAIGISQCKSENYSNGYRVGYITKFNSEGVIYKTWEGEMNVTQTGTNTAGEIFNFSIDRKNKKNVPNDAIIRSLNDALENGSLVKIKYRKVWGCVNLFRNRGDSPYFIDAVEVLER